MVSISSTILVLFSAFGLINAVPTKAKTTSTKVTHHAVHSPPVVMYPYVYNAPVPSYNPHAGLTSMTHSHYPYIYGTTGTSHQVSHHMASPISTHHDISYPYIYGWRPSTSHMSNYHLAAPYPYTYGWSSPSFSHVMPNYGLTYSYPPALYKTGYSGYY